jgi:hypothetical protein
MHRVKAKLRDDRRPPELANETWAMDFVHDQLATGRKIRVLTIVDTFTRYAPAIEPRFGYRAGDLIEVLERVGREHGFPQAIRVEQGGEFVSRELDLLDYQRRVVLDLSRPGKPTDNAFIESLNGKFRAECLNAHWFMSLDDARAKCEAWRRDYNGRRIRRPPAQRDRQQTAGEPGEIGQRYTAHADRVALEDARQGGPRMGSRSSLRRTLAQSGGIPGGRVTRLAFHLGAHGCAPSPVELGAAPRPDDWIFCLTAAMVRWIRWRCRTGAS